VGYTRLTRFGAPSNKSGTVTVKLPDSVDATNCNIQLFLERCNGQTNTDFATKPVLVDTANIPSRGEIAFSVTGGAFTYDMNKHGVTVSGAEGCTLTYSTDGTTYSSIFPTVANVADGQKTVYVKATKDGYEATTRSATIQVTAREVSIQWPTQIEFEFNNTEHSVTPAIGNVMNGEDVSLIVSDDKKTDVGSYTAKVTSLSGNDSANYVLPARGTTQSWSITSVAEETKSLKILFIGNSLSMDAWTFLPEAADQYSFLDSENVEFGALYQGGRPIGYFANCARKEKNDTEYDTSYYAYTNDRNKTQMSDAGIQVENNGNGDPAYNFCEYYKWNGTEWVQEKGAANYQESTIKTAVKSEYWDVILIQGYFCDFFGEHYDSAQNIASGSTKKGSAWSEENLNTNLTYLVNYLRELQSDVKIGFYLPTVHQETHWDNSFEDMYADMMARKDDISDWNIVDFFISGATAMENAKTTYLGTATYTDTVSRYNKDNVLKGLRRDAIHSSYHVGRELLSMTVAEYVVRHLYDEAGLVEFDPIETITSPGAGVLPKEYADILHEAVDETIKNPYQVTSLTTFSAEDPAITAYDAAKTAKDANGYYDECLAAAKTALSEKQREDLKVNSGTANGKITLSFTYGYTTSQTLEFEVPAETYTVSFDANGGGGTMTAVTGVSVTYTLPSCTFTAPAGTQFKGWALSAEGSVISGTSIELSANTTLYAIWENIPVAEYTISFDVNGGSGTVSSQTTTNHKLATLPTATRSGSYSFDGWYTAASGGTKITTSYEFSANTTVYAHWTYTGNSGGGGGSSYTYYTITASVDGYGSISPSGSVSVRRGTDKTFTITPDKGYAVAKVLVDGKNVGAVKSYTFENVKTSHTIKVVFMKTDGNPQTGVFVDVETGSYYEDAVDWAVSTGITKGTTDTTFSPDGICTRAQAVTFLWRAAGSPEPKTTEMPFTDVPADMYYYKAVLWAVENGITVGIGNDRFAPDAICTRAQIVTFLFRANGSKVVDGEIGFSDVAANAWYAEAVKWAEKNGITVGIGGGLFGPDLECTRAQIVTFLYRNAK